MRSRVYKIKNKTTQQYWTGYGSSFNEKGTEFTSWDNAAHEIRRQARFKYDISSWLNDAEIVEYEVSITETNSQRAIHGVQRIAFYEALQKQYGRDFVKHYHKMNDNPETKGKYHHAIRVPHDHFVEFREALKRLGYSSRNYKKTDSWCWIEKNDVMMRVKLLDFVTHQVDLDAIEETFAKQVEDVVALYLVPKR